MHKGANPLAIIDSHRTSTLECAIKHNKNAAKVIIEHCAQNNTLTSHLQENEGLLKLLCSNTEILDFTLKALGFDALAQRASDVYTQYKDAIAVAKATHDTSVAYAMTKHQKAMTHVMSEYRKAAAEAKANPDSPIAESISTAAEAYRLSAAHKHELDISAVGDRYRKTLASLSDRFSCDISNIIDGVRANDPTDYTDTAPTAPVLPLGLDKSSDDVFDPTLTWEI